MRISKSILILFTTTPPLNFSQMYTSPLPLTWWTRNHLYCLYSRLLCMEPATGVWLSSQSHSVKESCFSSPKEAPTVCRSSLRCTSSWVPSHCALECWLACSWEGLEWEATAALNSWVWSLYLSRNHCSPFFLLSPLDLTIFLFLLVACFLEPQRKSMAWVFHLWPNTPQLHIWQISGIRPPNPRQRKQK